MVMEGPESFLGFGFLVFFFKMREITDGSYSDGNDQVKRKTLIMY